MGMHIMLQTTDGRPIGEYSSSVIPEIGSIIEWRLDSEHLSLFAVEQVHHLLHSGQNGNTIIQTAARVIVSAHSGAYLMGPHIAQTQIPTGIDIPAYRRKRAPVAIN